jgi:HPt (histidine-containing phosphotransfer) domain-containing protein
MTAYSMQNDRERFLNAGMDDYVPKPIRANILIQKVNEIIVAEQGERRKGEGESNNSNHHSSLITHHSSLIQSDIPLLDMEIVNQLKEMVGSEMLMSVYADFEREAEEQITNAKKAFPDDVKTIQAELHTLKGNSGTIGLMRIHEITKIIEEPSKTGDLSDFESRIAILEKEFADFREVIRQGAF